jgi:hypothetical protein
MANTESGRELKDFCQVFILTGHPIKVLKNLLRSEEGIR